MRTLRRFALPLLLCISAAFTGCASDKKAGTPEVTVTPVAPLSPAQAQAIQSSILSGRGLPLTNPPLVAQNGCDKLAKLHPGFTSGYLEVPEDWDHPEAQDKIKIFYLWRKAENRGKAKAPVVFFNGGPGGDSHQSYKQLAPLPFTKQQSFVFIDQRGTGCSSPFPSEMNAATAQRMLRWGTRGIVGDAEAVRKHLFGEQRWRAFGQSYGGLIVHRYLELAPHGLDRAIAHGASVMKDSADWVAERILSQKRVSDSYFERYPQDREALIAVRAAISPQQCWSQRGNKICGPAVLDSLTLLLGFQTSWPDLHQLIESLQSPHGINQAALNKVLGWLVFGMYLKPNLGPSVISKMEIVPGFDEMEGCLLVDKKLRQRGETPDSFEFNECRLFLSSDSVQDVFLKDIPPMPINLDKIIGNLSDGRIAFFLFSGQHDTFIPVAAFKEEVEALGSRVHYKSFPDSGHEGYETEPDVFKAVSD